MPRPRQHADNAAKHRASRARKAERLVQQKELADKMKAAIAAAAAHGVIPLLTESDIEAAQKVVEFFDKFAPSSERLAA